MLRHNVGHR